MTRRLGRAHGLMNLQVATRDRRGRNVMAYAAEESQTHKLLDSHMEVLEKRASALQVTAECCCP